MEIVQRPDAGACGASFLAGRIDCRWGGKILINPIAFVVNMNNTIYILNHLTTCRANLGVTLELSPTVAGPLCRRGGRQAAHSPPNGTTRPSYFHAITSIGPSPQDRTRMMEVRSSPKRRAENTGEVAQAGDVPVLITS